MGSLSMELFRAEPHALQLLTEIGSLNRIDLTFSNTHLVSAEFYVDCQ